MPSVGHLQTEGRTIMEIERKFLVRSIPADLDGYTVKHIEQGYISADPVIRVRRTLTSRPGQRGPHKSPVLTDEKAETFTLTVKGRGLMVREELNLPITKEAYEHLIGKAEGRIIRKDRYLIPLTGDVPLKDRQESSRESGSLVCELDIFREDLAPLVLAEVEFSSEEEAEHFTPPDWFADDVTADPRYQNASMVFSTPADQT